MLIQQGVHYAKSPIGTNTGLYHGQAQPVVVTTVLVT
ncbi:hypothetical protein F441_21919 [Phytophthora nicotianae CJ01A1]|uniref:Uncharacterized protein n=3 Tax=Phytophthora nicotianae TaxID=4792 RepID=W2PA45_PHYN3|nr:hypothetical protein PPTG_24792 [Phytophthora nicotianae INRA-310]ETK71292.1 hypothetical protein L915_21437 [Phytophthora nicotianae]ETP00722.1 hypothetical protein F441_21919 [Phytophthora nicotianae CJ01A1]ETL24746.1 hypothetical protein L916_21303 [Phytophthora nicotianae]ETL77956.1 hypothetical protein L917_21154 [Phytophthora nicotianae]ETM31988.1 hypothetical protein L914_20518 [Phytophthora nicotianae]